MHGRELGLRSRVDLRRRWGDGGCCRVGLALTRLLSAVLVLRAARRPGARDVAVAYPVLAGAWADHPVGNGGRAACLLRSGDGMASMAGVAVSRHIRLLYSHRWEMGADIVAMARGDWVCRRARIGGYGCPVGSLSSSSFRGSTLPAGLTLTGRWSR